MAGHGCLRAGLDNVHSGKIDPPLSRRANFSLRGFDKKEEEVALDDKRRPLTEEQGAL